jgi:hypothetical protein
MFCITKCIGYSVFLARCVLFPDAFFCNFALDCLSGTSFRYFRNILIEFVYYFYYHYLILLSWVYFIMISLFYYDQFFFFFYIFYGFYLLYWPIFRLCVLGSYYIKILHRGHVCNYWLTHILVSTVVMFIICLSCKIPWSYLQWRNSHRIQSECHRKAITPIIFLYIKNRCARSCAYCLTISFRALFQELA